ncbi:PorV/PorQ family protein [Gracilimonas halophila]|uniref:PorV/PorQ family protein n=1 Tax=Gracilimonas halophila TaxID=1834464 RepID=A0ABW5JIA4_9BACT
MYKSLLFIKMIKIFLFFIVIVGLNGKCCLIMAQNGQSAVQFLKIEPDARVSAIGGAGVTILDGGFGGYYNPASLGWQQGVSAGFSYSNWLPGITNDVRYNRFAGTYQMGAKSSLALYMTYLNLGEQMATDESNAELGTFSNQQMSTGLSYGREVSRRLALGVGVKYIYSSIGSGQTVIGQAIDPAWSIAADIGALWRSGEMNIFGQSGEFRVGSSLSHVGSGLSYLGGKSVAPLPQTFRVGVAMQRELGASGDQQLILSLDTSRLLARMHREVSGSDTSWTSAGALSSLIKGWGTIKRFDGMDTVELGFFDQFTIGLGAEYWFRNLFAIRSGYYSEHPDNGDRRFMTMGAGIRYLSTEFDLSYLKTVESDHPLDGTLRVSLRIHFDGGYKKPKTVSKQVRNLKKTVITTKDQPVTDVKVIATDTTDVNLFQNNPDRSFDILKDSVTTERMKGDQVTMQNFSQEYEDFEYRQEKFQIVGFPVMSSQLTQIHRDRLSKLIVRLQKEPDLSLRIVGHTDNTGSDMVNLMLSESRARAVCLELLSYGIIDPDRLLIEAKSSNLPLAGNKTLNGGRLNRKVDIIQEQDYKNFEADYGRYKEQSSTVNFATPINKGNEFYFDMLKLKENTVTDRILEEAKNYLRKGQAQVIGIAGFANYSASSSEFINEIVKARSEFIKEKLIRAGVASHKIIVMQPNSNVWNEVINPILSDQYDEQLWLIPGSADK